MAYQESKKEVALNYIFDRFRAEANRVYDEARVRIKKLMMSGYSKQEAKQIVLQEVKEGKGTFNTVFNRQGKIIRPMSLDLVDEPPNDYIKDHPDATYDWVLGYAHKHCSDCLMLSKKEPRTVEEWRELDYGLPREGKTKCGPGCNCMLQRVENT